MFEVIRAPRTSSSWDYAKQGREKTEGCAHRHEPDGGISVRSLVHEADHRFTVEGFVCGRTGRAFETPTSLSKTPRFPRPGRQEPDMGWVLQSDVPLQMTIWAIRFSSKPKESSRITRYSSDPKDLESERKSLRKRLYSRRQFNRLALVELRGCRSSGCRVDRTEDGLNGEQEQKRGKLQGGGTKALIPMAVREAHVHLAESVNAVARVSACGFSESRSIGRFSRSGGTPVKASFFRRNST